MLLDAKFGFKWAKSLATKFIIKWILDFEVDLFPNEMLGNIDFYHPVNVTWIYNQTLRLKMAITPIEISSFEP